jgi:hypothetical protein
VGDPPRIGEWSRPPGLNRSPCLLLCLPKPLPEYYKAFFNFNHEKFQRHCCRLFRKECKVEDHWKDHQRLGKRDAGQGLANGCAEKGEQWTSQRACTVFHTWEHNFSSFHIANRFGGGNRRNFITPAVTKPVLHDRQRFPRPCRCREEWKITLTATRALPITLKFDEISYPYLKHDIFRYLGIENMSLAVAHTTRSV